MRHINGEPPSLASVRPDLPPGVVAWVHAMLAKQPEARPDGAARAWDRLDGVLCDSLGPRWRRAGALEETEAPPAPVTSVEIDRLSEMSGFVSLVLPPVRELPAPVAEPVRRPRRRPLALALALAVVLLVAVAASTLPAAPGEEPRAAQPAGPSLAQRLRDVVTPAVRANARLSDELSSLEVGTKPVDALDRVDAAMPAADAALAGVRRLGVSAADERLLRARADRALRTQAHYLKVVRATLTAKADGRELDGLSARLVSRLERIEGAVPRASESVRGVRRLTAWATAQIAATEPPLTTHPAAQLEPAPSPTPSATPTSTPTPTPSATPTPTPTPTPSATPTTTPEASLDSEVQEGARRIHPRRARLRERLELLLGEPAG
jgi:hypothetical protein